ncbi:lactadherin-like [Argopecten irradians]|uniref:lactadherin-like n=1 Tax=Argopecten irradians TaxID=31199 RepID=UPI00371CE0C1
MHLHQVQFPEGGKTVCSEYLVSGINGVDDAKLTSSSQMGQEAHHAPSDARLYSESSISSAWVSCIFDGNQYIQVQFHRKTNITAVLLQGRKETHANQFVTSFYVSYSSDGSVWAWLSSVDQQPILFPGNTDRNTVVKSTFNTSITASYLRITSKTWSGFPVLRFDVSGCYDVTENGKSDKCSYW